MRTKNDKFNPGDTAWRFDGRYFSIQKVVITSTSRFSETIDLCYFEGNSEYSFYLFKSREDLIDEIKHHIDRLQESIRKLEQGEL